METFVSSGFTAVLKTKAKKPPVSENFKTLDLGPQSGQIQDTVVPDPEAAAYQIQYAAVPAGGGTPTAWQAVAIGSSVRKGFTISNLTPGTTYLFEVRSVKHDGGYSDWSNPIPKMVI